MSEIINAFYLVASLFLLWNTVSDMRHKEIDSRFNFGVTGALAMLYCLEWPGWIIVLAGLVTVPIMTLALKEFARAGAGDIEAVAWMVPAFLLIDPMKFLKFWLAFTGLYILSFIVFRLYKRPKGERFAFYPHIFGAWLIAIFW